MRLDRFAPRLARLAGVLAAATALAACATVGERPAAAPAPAVETIQILGLNDFHGNIEPPSPTTYFVAGEQRREQLGGAARLGAALAQLRQDQAHTITVAAGDLIGGSPLVSAQFLDEPSIMALNRLGLSLASVGNHEFDRGTDELRRMQAGGCDRHTVREPCQLDRPFEGARFTYLAANVLDAQGRTLFPGTAMRSFGGVKIGFIGMTLKETGVLVSPAGTRGYRFADEADTANALAAQLRAQGADAVVLLIHQGANVTPPFNTGECPELSGDILPILDRLDPAIRLVVSGHTHQAYICQRPAADGSLRTLTSAGRYGYFVTDIHITVDPASDRVLAITAVNTPVTEAAGEQQDIAAIARRYADAAAPVAARVVGRIEGSFEVDRLDVDSPLGNLIADAQLAATRGEASGGADIAFINSGGVRRGFSTAADGSVTYGQLFTLQPFGNTLVVLAMTGADLKRLLEQQFGPASPATINQSLLIPSEGFTFSFDRSRPPGQRIVAMALEGQPIDPAKTYRVTVNNFLASGGDGFSVLAETRAVADGGVDLDALEAYIARGVRAPAVGRVTDVTPQN
ncbi:MAG TPA: bifunctional metallophosphatase/5'-nucleotidase [Croceibacterium sp.]|nr:bifunctional metallophosphatase/5'-nucleotidase [Croceibacterium sp.]